jgi:hypothetical protein
MFQAVYIHTGLMQIPESFMKCVPCRAVTAAVPATKVVTSMKVMGNTIVQQP